MSSQSTILRGMSTQHKIRFIYAHITSYRIFLKFGTVGQPSINSEIYKIKITLEFRHQPVFNSIHLTIYTGLPKCAKFEKNPITGHILLVMCYSVWNFMLR